MKDIFRKMDKPLFFLMLLFCIFGLIMVFSSSSVSAILRYNTTSMHFFTNQLIFMSLSFILGLIILRIPTSKYNHFSWLLMISIDVALVLLLVYGTITNHVQSWFYIAGFSIQPSEFAKSIIIIFLACFYNKLFKKKNYNIYTLFFPLVLSGIAVLLTILQPDFGSAFIIFSIIFFIFISLPIEKKDRTKLNKICFILGLLICALVVCGKDYILNEEQLERLNFKEPCTRYTDQTGYQVCNGFIAINNGGLLGVGLGNSTQKYLYLPESHTDFIFAIIVEELGVITGIIVVIMYILLLLRILFIARRASNLRNSIIAYGTLWYILMHVVVNLCGVLGIVPLTGVPLPLLSYGGSHTLNILIMLFLVLRVSIENKTAIYKEEMKKLSN